MKIYLDSAVAKTWSLPVSLPTYLNLLQAAGDQGLAELMLQLPSTDPVQLLTRLSSLSGILS